MLKVDGKTFYFKVAEELAMPANMKFPFGVRIRVFDNDETESVITIESKNMEDARLLGGSILSKCESGFGYMLSLEEFRERTSKELALNGASHEFLRGCSHAMEVAREAFNPKPKKEYKECVVKVMDGVWAWYVLEVGLEPGKHTIESDMHGIEESEDDAVDAAAKKYLELTEGR